MPKKAFRIPLGAFELHVPIAQGGMAEVWSGIHTIQNIPVAIKVLTSNQTRQQLFRDILKNEIRTVAGLYHPNIIMVWDCGEVSEEAETLSEGRLLAGSPYLVMEYAGGGTLSQRTQKLNWQRLKRLLWLILDALSHAHARGVIHLDLKPGNLLWVQEDENQYIPKLSDFGIAYLMNTSMIVENDDQDQKNTLARIMAACGTPRYMAPEQFSKSYREFGTWTDLYALGCIAYELVVGKPLFVDSDVQKLALSHITKSPPQLVPRFEVPSGFEWWIRQLLSKAPEKRFQRAADAAWALSELELNDDDLDDAEQQDSWYNVLKQKSYVFWEESSENICDDSISLEDMFPSLDLENYPTELNTHTEYSIFEEARKKNIDSSEKLQNSYIAINMESTWYSPEEYPALLNRIVYKPSQEELIHAIDSADMLPFSISKDSNLPNSGHNVELIEANEANSSIFIERGNTKENQEIVLNIDKNNNNLFKEGQVVFNDNISNEKKQIQLESASIDKKSEDKKQEKMTIPSEISDIRYPTKELVRPDSLKKKHIPPIPTYWQAGSRTSKVNSMLLGSGAGVFGMRMIPIVDRELERNRLWEILKKVHDTKSTYTAIIHGAAGVGKSRLAQWVSERAEEVGAGILLRATHAVGSREQDAIQRMVAQTLHCQGLSREEATKHIANSLQRKGVQDPYIWNGLAEICFSPLDVDTPTDLDENKADSHDIQTIHFASSTERYALIFRWLLILSLERPLVLWFEDVHWGFDALNFIIYVLKAQNHAPSPIFFILTLQEETLATRLLERRLLQQIFQFPNVERFDIAPLKDEDHKSLIQQLLCLDKPLMQTILAKTEGNPLFSIQLLGSLIQQNTLELAKNGFKLKDGVIIEIPHSLYHVWMSHVQYFIKGQNEFALIALELAAALGQEFQTQEWEEVCRLAKIEIPKRFIEKLMEQQVILIPQFQQFGSRIISWAFSHGMLRDVLVQESRYANRWEQHNLICAQVLSDLYKEKTTPICLRIITHLQNTKNPDMARESLLSVIEGFIKTGEIIRANNFLDIYKKILEDSKIAQSNINWGYYSHYKSWILWQEGHFNKALIEIKTTIDLSKRFKWNDIYPSLLIILAKIYNSKSSFRESKTTLEELLLYFSNIKDEKSAGYYKNLVQCYQLKGIAERETGNFELAQSYLWRALLLSRDNGFLYEEGNAMRSLGLVAQRFHRYQEAMYAFQEAEKIHQKIGDQYGLAMALRCQCRVIMSSSKDLQKARPFAEKALLILERIGATSALSETLLHLGEMERIAGNYILAEQHYKKTILLIEDGSNLPVCIPKMNLAFCYLALSNYSKSYSVLMPLQPLIDELKMDDVSLIYRIALLLAISGLGKWNLWETLYNSLDQYANSLKLIEPPDAWMIEKAGDIAMSSNKHEYAKQAYSWAIKIWDLMKENSRKQFLIHRVNGMNRSSS